MHVQYIKSTTTVQQRRQWKSAKSCLPLKIDFICSKLQLLLAKLYALAAYNLNDSELPVAWLTGEIYYHLRLQQQQQQQQQQYALKL